jgi:hypothetical protein
VNTPSRRYEPGSVATTSNNDEKSFWGRSVWTTAIGTSPPGLARIVSMAAAKGASEFRPSDEPRSAITSGWPSGRGTEAAARRSNSTPAVAASSCWAECSL